MKPTRWTAAVMLLGVVTAACGARLPNDVRNQAADSVLKQGQVASPGPATAPTTGPASTTAPVPVGPNPQPDQANPSVASTTGPIVRQSSASGPTTQPTTVPTTTTGTATCGTGTDVGLTSTMLTIGTIATLTGPVAGLFQGAIQGIESYASYVNATQGGICGHQLHVDTADDGTNCTQDQNATQSLIGKAFALVGGVALYDGCGATILAQHPTVPDVHLALDAAAQRLPNHFDLNSKESGYATGMFHYYAQKYGSKVQHVGTIIENIPSAVSQQANQVNAAESQGWKFIDSIKEQPTNSSFVGDFVKLCTQEHIQIFYLLTEPAGNAATMMHNEAQAGCPKSLINIVPIAYDQGFISDFGGGISALNGLQGYSEYALFYNKGEAANIPALQQLQAWFDRDYPGQPLNLYAMYAWVNGLMFTQAVEHAGKVISRTSVLKALQRMKNFTGGGITSPRDPGAGPGVHCYILWQLENGQFSRIDDPKSGFRCDGRFLPRPGG